MILDSSTMPIGLLQSGGLDSCILLARLLEEGHQVQPFYIRSGLVWEREELEAAKRFMAAVRCRQLADLVILNLPLGDLYNGHWSVTGQGAPDACSPDRAVYLPGRNALLLIKAALWCRLHGVGRLALAVLGSSPFGDATAGFFDDFESALHRATGGRVRLVRPFAQFDKRRVMCLGRGLPLELTFSCIAPAAGIHCGRCNKCAERSAAFRLIDADDPTEYAADIPNPAQQPLTRP
jgi:7-cyano-7-deazaguanine synthase